MVHPCSWGFSLKALLPVLCLSFPRRAGSDAPFGAVRAGELRGSGQRCLLVLGLGTGERVSVWAMSQQLTSPDATCSYQSILAPSHPLACAAADSRFPAWYKYPSLKSVGLDERQLLLPSVA